MKHRILVLVSAMALAVAAWAQTDLARITYVKEFPGSDPDYVAISVQKDGQCSYRTAPDDDKPVAFQISPEFAGQIFNLAGKLNFFQNGKLEANKKVARMGKKTFSYEDGTAQGNESFNYTENPDALALTTIFEGLSRTEWHRDKLEYLLRFDRLGVVKQLLNAESNLDQGQLAEPELLIPILEKIQKNDALVHVAQERAAGMLVKIQTNK